MGVLGRPACLQEGHAALCGHAGPSSPRPASGPVRGQGQLGWQAGLDCVPRGPGSSKGPQRPPATVEGPGVSSCGSPACSGKESGFSHPGHITRDGHLAKGFLLPPVTVASDLETTAKEICRQRRGLFQGLASSNSKLPEGREVSAQLF